MSVGSGRDPIAAMMRLVRILTSLHTAGVKGRKAGELVDIAGYGSVDPNTQLKRDLNHLTTQGWQIENVTTDGGEAVYRMQTADNRLRLLLTAEQRAALQRAVMVAERGDIAKRLGVEAGRLPEGFGSVVLPHRERTQLNLALQALRLHSRIAFRYKGKSRDVEPGSVRHENNQWYLSGVEVGDHVLKHFVVSRMSEVALGEPSSAHATPEVERIRLHPLQWTVDAPTEITLRVRETFVPDAVRWLMEPERQEPRGDDIDLTYIVTNRAAFRARIYQLGTRVSVVGPEQFRGELLDDLRDLVGL